MNPPIFEICYADTSIQSLLGSGDRLKLYPFGEASENEVLPYATWQVVNGSPENYLGSRADMDMFSIQVDVFAGTVSEAREIAAAIRSVVELHANVVSLDGESRDAVTRSYRYTLSVDWFVPR